MDPGIVQPLSVAATAWTKHDARRQQEVDPRERHPRIETTGIMDALAVLDALITQPGRHAVLRRELVEDLQRQGKTPASATRATYSMKASAEIPNRFDNADTWRRLSSRLPPSTSDTTL